MGGMLADPVQIYPTLFGPNSSFGGQNGVQWLMTYPYALPMLANAFLLALCAGFVAMSFEEVRRALSCGLDALANDVDTGRMQRETRAGRFCLAPLLSRRQDRRPFVLPAVLEDSVPRLRRRRSIIEPTPRPHRKLRDGRKGQTCAADPHPAFSENMDQECPVYAVCSGVFRLSNGVSFDFFPRRRRGMSNSSSAFNNLWLLFLSTPRFDFNDPASPSQKLPFIFTGGLGMLPQSVGFATAILGVIGMLLQFTVYPTINGRLGTAKSYQYFLSLFPLAYAFAPYISLAPSSTPPPDQANGVWVWFSIIVVLFLQVTARTFTLPTSIILLNNCSPHPSVLGTIHGIGQSVSSAFRTIGPIFSGSWYGYGLEIGMVGFAWWLIALVSVFGCVAAIFVYEGSGHEILLPGEEEEMQ